MKLVKSLKADEDLIDIYLFGFYKFGESQAEKYFSGLEETFALLANNPYLASESTELKQVFRGQSFRIHHHGSHKIIYTIEADHLLIVRVLHESALTELHL